ncbi:MAG: paraquat-inducible protein A [Pseudomonadota bacterium]
MNGRPARHQTGLLACHCCDALLTEIDTEPGQRLICPRCETVLTTSRSHSISGVLVSAICMAVLMVAAMLLPFISLSAGGLERNAAILDAARAVGGAAWPLALAVGAMIAMIPMARALALIYVLTPLSIGRAPAPGARAAFRLAIELRPWSMVEIFLIGVVVALVKVAGLASVALGAAFWLFVALALIAFYEDAALCRRTIWRMLA